MMKSSRHAAILDLIKHTDIETQEELAERLRGLGITVTQATVSRDIRELRLLKVLSGTGQYKYAIADKAENNLGDRFFRMFSESVLSVAGAENLIIVKTLSGSAHVAGEAIDSLDWPTVLGTIAGDNTVLVIVRSAQETPDVVNKFRDMMK